MLMFTNNFIRHLCCAGVNMERYHSEGGRSDPDFRYKVRVEQPTGEMFEWCNEYPSKGSGWRYYVKWSTLSSLAIFSFEVEEPSIMFALRWL